MRLPRPISRPLLAAALGALLLITVAAATLVRIPAGQIGVRRGVGADSRLDPGWHLRIPLFQSLTRYPTVPIALRGAAPFVTAEGAAGTVPYDLEVRLEPSGLVALDRARAGAEWIEFLRHRIETGLAEELPRAALIERLAGLGVVVERLEIGGARLAGLPESDGGEAVPPHALTSAPRASMNTPREWRSARSYWRHI